MYSVEISRASDKKTVSSQQLVDVLSATGNVKDRDELLRVIIDREKLMSTGIGNGVALPHGKTNVVENSLLRSATLSTPIDFDSLDDKPVQIILLLGGNRRERWWTPSFAQSGSHAWLVRRTSVRRSWPHAP